MESTCIPWKPGNSLTILNMVGRNFNVENNAYVKRLTFNFKFLTVTFLNL